MEAQLARWRTSKRHILAALPVYHELQPQVIHDINGEMGHGIGFFPETAAESEKVAAALGAEGVGCGTRGQNPGRDWHVYDSVDQILQKMSATSDGCPWHCSKTEEKPSVEYSPDMCPRTLDLTGRHVRVGVNQWWTERDCKQVAAAMTKVFDAFYTRDPNYENWLHYFGES